MERLDDLALFAEVVQRMGFAAAARSLGMQRSKLSRRVAELEERMGVRLLQRNTRRVSLTPAGERIYGHARTLVNEARAAFNVAAELNGEPRGVMRISSPASLAAVSLMPIVAEFCRQYPHLQVLVDTRYRQGDLVAEGFELAFCIQSTPLEDSSMVARFIGDVPMMVVSSPTLLERHGKLYHPSELSAFNLLAQASQAGMNALRFLGHREPEHVLEYTPHLLSGSIAVLRSAVVAGMGAACLPRYLCEEALRAKQLADVFHTQAGWRPEPARMYVILPSRSGVTLATRLFLEFALPRLAAFLGEETFDEPVPMACAA